MVGRSGGAEGNTRLLTNELTRTPFASASPAYTSPDCTPDLTACTLLHSMQPPQYVATLRLLPSLQPGVQDQDSAVTHQAPHVALLNFLPSLRPCTAP